MRHLCYLPHRLSTRWNFLGQPHKSNVRVEGCPWRATNHPNLRMHFIHRRMEDTIHILNEGNIPHLWCDQCAMFILREALATGHLGTTICKRREYHKNRCLAASSTREVARTKFRALDHVLVRAKTFNYLGRILSSDNNDCPAVDGNLWKARQKL